IASFWHMDESPLQLLKSDKAPSSDHYMVVQVLQANASSSTTTLLPGGVEAVVNRSKPVLEKFKKWIDDLLPGIPPNRPPGKALRHRSRQWPKLIRYVDHGDVPAHNNFVEQQIKHYATGKRREAALRSAAAT